VNRRPTRRGFGCGLGALGLGAVALAAPAVARAAPAPRRLDLVHAATRETFAAAYAENGAVLPAAQEALNWFLRDHHENAATAMDPALFDALWRLQERFRRARGRAPALAVTSAFRTERTNERLVPEGAARNSLHKAGKAVDLVVPGYGLHLVGRLALADQAGGLGLYWRDKFVHLDTGPRRNWYSRR
jgi:uncharacterized protein YcbK (DUF882 family)